MRTNDIWLQTEGVSCIIGGRVNNLFGSQTQRAQQTLSQPPPLWTNNLSSDALVRMSGGPTAYINFSYLTCQTGAGMLYCVQPTLQFQGDFLTFGGKLNS